MLGDAQERMEKKIADPLGDCRTTLDLRVRFRDADAMGHVNNAVYLSYLEEARLEYFRRVFGAKRPADIGFIVARVEIDYRSPALIGEILTAGVKVSRLGGASFAMDYAIIEKASRRLVAEARSVQVCYDYGMGKVQKMKPELVRKMREHDGLS